MPCDCTICHGEWRGFGLLLEDEGRHDESFQNRAFWLVGDYQIEIQLPASSLWWEERALGIGPMGGTTVVFVTSSDKPSSLYDTCDRLPSPV